jgi:hypothetical protein
LRGSENKVGLDWLRWGLCADSSIWLISVQLWISVDMGISNKINKLLDHLDPSGETALGSQPLGHSRSAGLIWMASNGVIPPQEVHRKTGDVPLLEPMCSPLKYIYYTPTVLREKHWKTMLVENDEFQALCFWGSSELGTCCVFPLLLDVESFVCDSVMPQPSKHIFFDMSTAYILWPLQSIFQYLARIALLDPQIQHYHHILQGSHVSHP